MKTYKDHSLEGLTDGLSSGRLGGRVIKEGLVKDLERSFKSGSGKEIKCGDYTVTPVKADHKASDFHVVVKDRSGKDKTEAIKKWEPDFIVYIDGKIHFETRDGKLRAPDKKTAKEIEDWCKQYSK